MSLLSNVFDATIVGGLRKPLKQMTGMSDAQLAMAAAAAATGGMAAGGAGLLGGAAAAAPAATAAPAAGAAGAAVPAASVAGPAAAPASSGLLGTLNTSLMAANSAKGLLGGQQAPIQSQPIAQAQGGAQTLQGLAVQGDQSAASQMQADEQARQQRRLAILRGGFNGRIA